MAAICHPAEPPAAPNRNALPAVTAALTKLADKLASLKVSKAGPLAIAGDVKPAILAWLNEFAALLNAEVIAPVLGKPAPVVTISVDTESRHQLGHYKPFRDGLGLMDRVSINRRFLARSRAEILRTLLHEQLHAYDHNGQGLVPEGCKRPANPHHRWFVKASTALGIPCDAKGHSTGIVEGSPFALFLKRHGIEGAEGLLSQTQVGKRPGSTLRKWVCGCEEPQIARIGKSEFHATCNLCGEAFRLAEGR